MIQFKMSELVTIHNALRLAVEQNKADAQDCRENNSHRLADQFNKQRLESLDVLERLEKEIGL